MRRPVVAFAVLVGLAGCGDLVPAQLEFVGVDPAQPRLAEIATVQFLARDDRGEPMAGVSVTFTLEGAGTTTAEPVPPGVTLHKPVGITNRGSGIVDTQISSTRVQSVIVVATVGDPASGGKQVRSPPITFAGARTPSAMQLTFQCGTVAGAASGGVHAINAYNDTRDLIAGVKLDCFAHVGDRNGDGIEGVLVSFLTEAGTIGPTATSMTDVIGNAQVLYKTSYPLPEETSPGTFSMAPVTTTLDDLHMPFRLAPLWMQPFDWKENPLGGTAPNLNEPRRFDPVRGNSFQNNPRDNLVALIAVTTGEEGFIDDNDNGVFDTDEIFAPFDLTEPFVDNNDNGTHDPSERWVDANGNGSWDGKNNQHDSNNLIWTMERIIWTGIPHPRDYNPSEPTVVQNPAVLNIIARGGVAFGDYWISDPWFNALAQNGGGDGCAMPSSEAVEAGVAGGNYWIGQALSYPSPVKYRVVVQDIRRGLPDGGVEPLVNRSVAEGHCEYTGSPSSGFTLKIPFWLDVTLP